MDVRMSPMNLGQTIHDLNQTLGAGTEPVSRRHLHTARQLLLDCGVAALGIEPTSKLSLGATIRIGVTAPANPDRRSFAVLLVHAVGVDGLVRVRSQHADLDRDICAFVESALRHTLHRSGYPFDRQTYDKIRFLGRLGGTIDQHLKPLEPTFPAWLSGLAAGEKR
jgi:hypothetical protein